MDDTRTPRINLEQAKHGPTAAELEATPATAAADWADAVEMLKASDPAALATGRAFAGLLDPANTTTRFDAIMQASGRDEGAGVDPAIRERLFERFSTTRHGEGGTGPGLAIVRAVAELHGGKAQLRESSAQGSVFSLTLPRA